MKDPKIQELMQVLVAYAAIAILFIIGCGIDYLFQQL